MEESRTGGGREFIFSVIWAIFMLCIGRGIIYSLPSYKIIGILITILMFCILGFFVLTRYAAVYTYTLKNDRLRINRSIGHRNKEVDFAVSEVKSVTRVRPAGKVKNTVTMRTSVFSRRNVWYVLYEKNRTESLLICDISRNMAEKLRSRSKNIKD